MITGELRNKVDKIWETFWTGGITNPLSVIEQFTYLIFIKSLDDKQIREEMDANDDDPKSQINDKPELKQNNKSAAQNRWIAYNRMRGQYASAMEHAAPEAFWVDKTKCSHTDENGRIQNPTLNPCAEAISAQKRQWIWKQKH